MDALAVFTGKELAALAKQGKVYGVDFSPASVAVATATNKEWINAGHVEIHEASVSQLPFADNQFDLVTAVETHFWWADLPSDMKEVFRVLKPGGSLVLIAEVYKGANSIVSKIADKYAVVTGMKMLSAEEHRALLASAGCSDIQITADSGKGWICAIGCKPQASRQNHYLILRSQRAAGHTPDDSHLKRLSDSWC